MNAFMEDHVEALFTPARLERLSVEVEGKSPEVREQIVMRALKDEVTHGGQRHWLDFKFTSEESNKTSHYIIFVSKNPTGLKPMKDIMAKVSSESVDGVQREARRGAPREKDGGRQPRVAGDVVQLGV